MLQEIGNEKYGFKFAFDSEDVFVGRNVAYAEYEPFESELFLSKIEKGNVVFDVGANIGYYSLLAAKKLKDSSGVFRKGKVFAFEPGLKNFLLLERNVLKNCFEDVVEIFNCAVGEEDGEIELFLSKSNQGDHRIYKSEENERESENVVMRSLGTIISEYAVCPDVVKIDTQGVDYLVLKGMQEFIDKSESLIVFTEFWDYGNKRAGISSKDNFDFFVDNFSKVLVIDEVSRSLKEIDFDEVMKKSAAHEGIAHLNFYLEK